MKLENKTINELKKICDREFSRYVRLKNMDRYGMVKCFTCGKMVEYKNIQNGHWITRKSSALRYNEKNCNPQCVDCNIWKKGNLQEYANALINKYDSGVINELRQIKNETKKFTHSELIEMIKYYRGLVKEF